MSQLDEFWAPVFKGKDLAGYHVAKWWKVTVTEEFMKSPDTRYFKDEELAKLFASSRRLAVHWLHVLVKGDKPTWGLELDGTGFFSCILSDEDKVREEMRKMSDAKLTPADKKILGIE